MWARQLASGACLFRASAPRSAGGSSRPSLARRRPRRRHGPRSPAESTCCVSAPTGSGKTLAAFLWALDRLSAEPAAPSPVATRVVYVSPLKALAYDIERNLRAPLRGIGATGVRVGIRTGDTPQRERAAMARKPPDILITTPESLYLILTSQARTMLSGVEAVIVDEIHAVAHSKRGSHLALTLERLEAQVRAAGPDDLRERAAVQRIGLSATQSPLEEIGRYLVGPHRTATIIDAGARKKLDLRIEVPVESMSRTRRPGRPRARPARAGCRRRVDSLLDLAGDLPGAPGARRGPLTPRSCSSTTAARPSAWRCG